MRIRNSSYSTISKSWGEHKVASDYRRARNRRITCCVYVELYWNINVHSGAAVEWSINLQKKINKNFVYPFLNSILYVRLVVKATQQPLYCREFATVSSLLEAGWASRSVRRGVKRKFLNPTEFRTPNLQACIESLWRISLRYPRPVVRIFYSLLQYLNYTFFACYPCSHKVVGITLQYI